MDERFETNELLAVLSRASSKAFASDRSALDGLAGELLGFLVDKGDNPVISPSCLYRTLALLAQMTGGATRSEIEGVLGGTHSMQAVVDAIERVGERSKPDRDVLWQGDGFCYSVGSSVWIDEKLELNPHFCANVQRTASCDVERVGMGTAEASKTMGSWLEGGADTFLDSLSPTRRSRGRGGTRTGSSSPGRPWASPRCTT